MAATAAKLRFVRCPKCLQLLVEYASIPVYQCGACGTVLRAKNRVAPVENTNSGSAGADNSLSHSERFSENSASICLEEQKIGTAKNRVAPVENTNSESAGADNSLSHSERFSENSASICLEEQKITPSSSNAQLPGEKIREEKIASPSSNAQLSGENVMEEESVSSSSNSQLSGENVMEEKNSFAGENFEPGENAEEEKVSIMDSNTSSHRITMESKSDEGFEASCNRDLIRETENMMEQNGSLNDENEDANSQKIAVGSMLDEGFEASSNHHLIGEAENMMEQNGSLNDENEDASSQKITMGRTLDEGFEASCGRDLMREAENMMEQNGSLNDENENASGPQIAMEITSAGGIEANCNHGLIGEAEIIMEQRGSLNDENENSHGTATNSKPDGVCEAYSNPDLVAETENIMEHKSTLSDENVNSHGIAANSKPDGVFEAYSNPDLVGDTENIMEQKSSLSDENAKSHETAADSKLKLGFRTTPNHALIGEMERPQLHEGFQAESHEDLIDELERSLSLSDVEEDFVDIVNGNGLDKALHSHSSRRFSLGGKVKGGSQGDPHDRLIEALERSFSDAEESSDHHSVATDENIAERGHGNRLDKGLTSLASRSANLDDGSVSLSEDGPSNVAPDQILLKSRRTFRQREPAVDDNTEKESDPLENEMPNHVEMDHGATPVLSELSNDRFHSTLPSFDKRKEESPPGYRAHELRQGLSLDSEDFQSIQNFIESQMDGTSSSLSSGSPVQGDLIRSASSKFKSFDRMERLKKMDELRNQLSRLSTRQGLENRYHNKGMERQLQSHSYKPKQQLRPSLTTISNPGTCTLESYHDPGRPPRCPQIPFSPQHSCPHCRFGHREPHLLHNCSTMEYNSYYQPSYAGSFVGFDNESLKSSFKERKRPTRKHILRPLSGATPYTICYSCFNLLQMPSDMFISKRKLTKVQCGRCSKILMLSFCTTNCLGTKISKEAAREPNKTEDDIEARFEQASSHSAECIKGNPVSISGEHGISFTRSFSSRVEEMLQASDSDKKISESALHRLMGYNSATELLRQSGVLDDGYESFESMVPVSYRISKRKNS